MARVGPVRAVPQARRGHGRDPRRHRARRADRRDGAGAAAAPSGDRELGVHPETGLPVQLKAGRFGPYVQMGEHDDETGLKPATASLFKDMDPAHGDARRRRAAVVAATRDRRRPADGEEITAQNGRYGPYIKKGNDSRTIESEELLFDMTLEQAQAIFAQPKMRRGQVAKPPLKDLGADPDCERPLLVKDGRFGPYVTDGETNASLQKGRLDRGAHPRARAGAARRSPGRRSFEEEGRREEEGPTAKKTRSRPRRRQPRRRRRRRRPPREKRPSTWSRVTEDGPTPRIAM